MAIPQIPYPDGTVQDTLPPGDPGPLIGTLQEVPGVVGDALDAYGRADRGLARTLNSHLPFNLFPVDPTEPVAAPPPATMTPSQIPASTTPESSALADAVGAGGGPSAQQLLDVANRVGADTRRTHQVQTAGEKQAAGELGAVSDAQADLAREKGLLGRDKALDLQSQIERENRALETQEREAIQQRVRMDRAVQEADGYLKQRRDAFAKDGMRPFYEDSPKGTASLIASALATGLGGWASALGGGPNTAWMIVKDATDRWENRERARLDQQRDLISLAERGVDRAEQRKAAGEIEIKNRRLALLEGFERQRLENAAKYGVREEALATDATLLKIREDKARTQFEIQKGLRTTVETSNAAQQELRRRAMLGTGGPDKSADKADAAERKADAFMMKAASETKKLQNLKPYSAADTKVIEDWRRRLGSTQPTTWDKFQNTWGTLNSDAFKRLSPEGRRRFEAETALGISLLRPESGAVIGPTEIVNKLTPVQIFANDSPEAAREKADRRRVELEALAVQSFRPGYWARQISPQTVSASPQAGQPAREPVKLSSQESATLLRFIKTNESSADPVVRAKVDAARAALGSASGR